jgi:hypothetical protein
MHLSTRQPLPFLRLKFTGSDPVCLRQAAGVRMERCQLWSGVHSGSRPIIPTPVAQTKSHCGRGGNRNWRSDDDLILTRPDVDRAFQRLERFLSGDYAFPVVLERVLLPSASAMLTVETFSGAPHPQKQKGRGLRHALRVLDRAGTS